jgi:hypothetical protein
MAKALAPQNPLAEVAELFSKDGLAHKDLNNLTVAIDGLISTLEKRAGKDSSILGRMGRNPRDPYSDGKTPRSLKNDVIGFGRGLVDSFTTDPKQYLTGKSSLPDTIEKIDPTLDDTKLPDMKIPAVEDLSKEQPQPTDIEPVATEQPQPTDIEPVATEQPQSNIQPIDTNNNNGEQDSNKVLSDMVEVLIDLRDDKTQNQILQEAIEIRKIIHDQSKKVELPGGLEPNSDSAKQEDREKLAEAIATRLKDVMGDMGSNSGLGIPDLDIDKKKKPGGKAVSPSGGSSKGKMGGRVAGVGAGLAMVGAGAAVDYGVGKLGVGKDEEGNDLQVDEKQDDENWDKMTVGEKIQSGMARGVEKVGSSLFLGNIANEAKSERIKNETKYLKDKKVAAPVGETDAQASLRIASENDAREEARIEAKGSGTYVGNEKLVSGQPLSDKQMRANELSRSMGNSPTVEPKPTVNSVGKLLETKTDENTDLKYNMSESKTQMIAPIVSNKTNNYTEQTIIGTPPSPHPSTNSFLRFQNKISGYTDSVR